MRKSILILVCLALGGVIAYVRRSSLRSQPQVADTENSLTEIATAVSDYKRDCLTFPESKEWLKNLMEKGSCSNWKGPYLHISAKDSWGHEFYFKNLQSGVEIGSYGEDGKEGGEGRAADIQVWVD